MILQRLYELAEREHLLEDPAFVSTPVACRVDITQDGRFLGLMDLRERREVPSKSKKGKPRIEVTAGREFSVPVRPVAWDEKRQAWKTTDAAASGKEKPAVFLADTLARVLPVDSLIANEKDLAKQEQDRLKSRSQRSTFRRFARHAAQQSADPALQTVATFVERIEESSEMQAEVVREIESKQFRLSDLCTFAIHEDGGTTVLDRPAVREWWRAFYDADSQSQQEGQFVGPCQVTQRMAPIAETVKSRINGLIPIGCRAEAYLVTGLPAADSYNLPGAVSGMVSARGIDGFTRALNSLIANDKTSRRVAGTQFLFWTRQPAAHDFMNLFEPRPENISALLRSIQEGKQHSEGEHLNAFYLLVLTGNSARVAVRDYLEAPLWRIREHLATWFSDLQIADATRDGAGAPTCAFPLWQLAIATALDSDQVAPDAPARLMTSALSGGPIPDSLLVSALGRLRAEGSEGFRPARMALIKLILIRREASVSVSLDNDEIHPAYVYGRLLSVFEDIQFAALGDVNATVVDKFYGTFSAAPALVFSRLYANAQNHLRKLRGEKEAAFVALDRRLTEITRLMPATPPRGHLSLQDQGRFALGYYHQKAKRFEEIAARKAKVAAAAE